MDNDNKKEGKFDPLGNGLIEFMKDDDPDVRKFEEAFEKKLGKQKRVTS
ncbi:hypothetical protein KAH94_05385 [bacterium]|nr:hypothetical protein [bacterium]